MSTALIYGAYGYTGELAAREAVQAGMDPILSGRREGPLREVADELGLGYRVATVDDLLDVLADADVDVCLHCAGPFMDTYEPVVEACLAAGTHYLDITGEIPVFEGVHAYDEAARDAGVMLLPGVGFDVVPSDCLSARLHEELPEATRLTLAFAGLDNISAGTARTAAHRIGEGVPIREHGDLRNIAYGSRTRDIDTGTGNGHQRMGVFPWPDVFTAYYTTGIPNIEVYAADVLGLSPTGQRVIGALQPVLRTEPVKKALEKIADLAVEGPDADERAVDSEYFWGEVTDGETTVTGRVHTTEGYQFTAEALIEITKRIRDGEAPPGFQTPAGAYGPGLVLDIGGSRFEDVQQVG